VMCGDWYPFDSNWTQWTETPPRHRGTWTPTVQLLWFIHHRVTCI